MRGRAHRLWPRHRARRAGPVAKGLLQGARAPRSASASIEEHPWFASQQRLTFARVGLIDPLDLAAYRASGGYQGLARALELGPAATVKEVPDSGLRGRGGAAFPTGIKWQTVLDQPPGQKYVTCNADEGDSGTFSDRMLMEGDPFCADRGHDDRGVRGRRDAGLHLPARRVSARFQRC